MSDKKPSTRKPSAEAPPAARAATAPAKTDAKSVSILPKASPGARAGRLKAVPKIEPAGATSGKALAAEEQVSPSPSPSPTTSVRPRAPKATVSVAARLAGTPPVASPDARRRKTASNTEISLIPEGSDLADAAALELPVTLIPNSQEVAQQVSIFQIYFEAAQLEQLDPGFIPWDNAGHDSLLREFDVFERLAAEPGVQIAPLWGALSWRFFEKTGLTAENLHQALQANPGCDLYYCNPSTESEAVYANLWQQGVTAHPAFREVCESVFEAAGLDLQQLDKITPSQGFSSCNYFVGSQLFWSLYLPFVRAIVDRARATLPKSVLRLLDSDTSDPRGLHAGASYWPFIIERLLPIFLRGPGAGLKTRKIVLPVPEARLNSHLKRLREMRDVAHKTRSQWLYSCWQHYRNLYLLQTAGRDWCTRYLPQLSPTSVAFW